MEKFGIFELLDTLSALLGEGEETDRSPAPAEKTAPSAEDEAFLPPSYGETDAAAAVSSFLNKHAETVKRIHPPHSK